jgi:hypothetical protein
MAIAAPDLPSVSYFRPCCAILGLVFGNTFCRFESVCPIFLDGTGINHSRSCLTICSISRSCAILYSINYGWPLSRTEVSSIIFIRNRTRNKAPFFFASVCHLLSVSFEG